MNGCPSKLFWAGMASACALGLWCMELFAEETPAPTSTERSYNQRIQMHSTPVELLFDTGPKTGNSSFPVQKDFFSSMSSFEPGAAISVDPSLFYTPAPMPADKKDKSKSWLNSAGEEKKKDENSKPSGWGWLADNLFEIQRLREMEQAGEAGVPSKGELTPSEEKLGETPLERTSRPSLQQGVIDDKPYEPVQTEALAPPQAGTLSSPDSLLAGQKQEDPRPLSTQKSFGKTAGDTILKTEPVPMTAETTTRGADSLWGLERTRSAGERAEPMPRTASLMREITHPKETPGASFSSFRTPSSKPGGLSGLKESSPTLPVSGATPINQLGTGYRPALGGMGNTHSPAASREPISGYSPGGTPSYQTQPLQPLGAPSTTPWHKR